MGAASVGEPVCNTLPARRWIRYRQNHSFLSVPHLVDVTRGRRSRLRSFLETTWSLLVMR